MIISCDLIFFNDILKFINRYIIISKNRIPSRSKSLTDEFFWYASYFQSINSNSL